MQQTQVFTSDHGLKLEWVPDWVAIIGSGYIGLEFSDVYTALGSEVTFIEVSYTDLTQSFSWKSNDISVKPQLSELYNIL